MRLEVLQNSRRLQDVEALRFLNGIGCDVQRAAAAGRCCTKQRQIGPVLRLLVFGIKPNSEFDVVANRLADGVVVDVPPNFRARHQQLAGVRAIDVVGLSDRPFHQNSALTQRPTDASFPSSTALAVLGSFCIRCAMA